MNFDIAVYGDDEKGNGAFNQNVLNVEAVGTASTDGDGNLAIDSMGSFPVSVNGVDSATTDFRLRLQAPAGAPGGDSTGPTIVAQYPSACGYGYNLSTEVTQIYILTESANATPSLDEDGNFIPESAPVPPDSEPGRVRPYVQSILDLDPPVDATEADCADYLGVSDNGAYLTLFDGPGFFGEAVSSQPGVSGINNVLPEESLSITFSEPVDPASLTDINGSPGAGTLQLAGPAGNVPATLRVEGSTVVIDPIDPLAYNTEYTLTVGTGITDLAGNPLAAGQDTAFNTAPFVPANDGEPVQGPFGPPQPIPNNIIQTSPFLTTLYPGLPCALEPTSGDFRSGGDMAGYCVGNDTASSAPQRAWSVFDLPANRAVHMVFSKPMRTDSITLADGCLTATSDSDAVAENNGAIAVQTMDGSGNCTGVVDGDIVVPHPGDATTRKANFQPAEPWADSQRYWLVICGSNDPGATCTGGQTLRDVDDGKTDGSAVTQREADEGFATHDGRLNTTPMVSTGTHVGPATNISSQGYGFYPAAGGPDLVMPFDGAPASRDQLLVSDLAPFTDVNGNGFADGAGGPLLLLDGNGNGVIDDGEEFSQGAIANLLSPEERERPQPANQVFARAPVITGTIAGRGQEVLIYNSGAQPASVGDVRSAADCQSMMTQAVLDMVGPNPGRCAPVTVHPGGLVAQTAGFSTQLAQYTAYGRTLLHTAGVADPEDPQRTVPQIGYIVDRCQGSYRINALPSSDAGEVNPEDISFLAGEIQTYDYGPCFVLEQKLIFTADPFANSPTLFPPSPPEVRDLVAPQQGLTVNLVGPVSFERNGRLVIRATNTNNLILRETRDPQLINAPGPVAIPAGNTTLQLVGPAIHGGPLEAFKTQ